jgi:hypothetical protein
MSKFTSTILGKTPNPPTEKEKLTVKRDRLVASAVRKATTPGKVKRAVKKKMKALDKFDKASKAAEVANSTAKSPSPMVASLKFHLSPEIRQAKQINKRLEAFNEGQSSARKAHMQDAATKARR